MNKVCLFLLCCMSLLLTGCWDEINIEERGFVVGISLDLAEEHTEDNPMITVTNQFVIPGGLGAPNEDSSGDQKPFNNLSIDGESVFEAIRKMSTMKGNAPFFEHLQLIVVSEELAREQKLFARTMDLFLRDQEMRRSVRILISENKAMDILDIEPDSEPLPVMYINNASENNDKVAGLLEPLRTGDLHEYLLEKNNYLIPRIFALDNEIQFNGAGVFNGRTNHLVGVINDEEIVGLNLITGDLKGGFIKFEINDQLMIYEIRKAKSNIKINADDTNNIHIDIVISTEGNIGEMYGERTLLEKDYLEEIETQINGKMESLAYDVIQKGKEELEMDFFGFGEMLQQRHYKKWEKIKDNWDEGENIFKNTTVKVKADAIVRTTGATDKVKDWESE
ncbi:Ger(x)C family spore germination protein [Gracilibacillus alcaliphilus]|uniref:Ger(x)C family spore germination protein n=1 Tax=Gracilibacillus alcaliphilus TaxID=1401441 RepID=UPI00195DFBBB|nr:Ger(x)C family spore germination protein [Gracilibacillus alcaliphilus]MBM7677810.1 spore germination protein [Gracilibacillus alcaliphilus]